MAITGTNFTGTQQVYFNGVPATSFTINSSTSITAVTPAQYAGVVDVTVQTYAGTSATSSSTQFTYTLASAPTISSIDTSSGSTAGGTTVNLTGTNFSAEAQVYFGAEPAASVTVNSSTSITVTSPPEAAGTVDIKVLTYGGYSASSSSDQFTFTAASAPTVTSLGTSSGSTAGGTSVTITGTDLTGTTAVNFGSVPAVSWVVNSSTSITAVSPAQAAATVDITVTTTAGTSSTGAGDQFTYSAASTPSITSVSPSSGSVLGGDTITINGSNFTGATAVAFGTTQATSFTVISDNAIVVTAPAGAAATVDITVTTYAGTSSTGSSDHYTYTAVSAPTITSLGTTSGTSGGGTSVTITGTNLLSTTAVYFGAEPATSFVVVSSTQIQAVSPPQAAGAYDVTVTANGLTSALSANDRYTYTAASAPAVSSVSPSSGSTNGTTSVTITGTGFTGASAVTFAGLPAVTFTVVSDTSITAMAPVQAAGVTDIVVTTPTGTSVVNSGDEFTYTAASSPTVTALSLSSGSTSGTRKAAGSRKSGDLESPEKTRNKVCKGADVMVQETKCERGTEAEPNDSRVDQDAGCPPGKGESCPDLVPGGRLSTRRAKINLRSRRRYNAWRRWLARLAITQRLVDGFGKSDIVEPDAVRPGVEQDCFYIVELTGTAAALKMLDCFRKNGTLLETWMPKAVQIPTKGVGTCSKDARRAMLKRQRADWRNRGNAAAKALRLRYHGEI